MVIYFFARTLERSLPCFVFCWCCEVHFQPNYGEVCFSLLSFFLQVISHFIWVFERFKKNFFYHGSFTIKCLVWISLYIPCLVYMVHLPMMNCLSSVLFFLNVVSLPFSFLDSSERLLDHIFLLLTVHILSFIVSVSLTFSTAFWVILSAHLPVV